MIELSKGQLIDPVVFRVDHNGKAIKGHGQLYVVNPRLGCALSLRRLDAARCVTNIDLIIDELLEAATGAGNADGDANLWRNGIELFCDRFADREHGTRAIDADFADQATFGALGF